ncbi:MAG: PQQ-binding-like beta-propeller repeat protein, partial [Planctomycetota bacterium]
MERPRRNGRRSTLIGPAAVVGLIALAGAAATAFWPPPPDERGWPALFGPDEDSSSRAWIDLGRIAERGPVEKWRRAIGTGYSSPVTADGRLIVQQRVPAVDLSSDGSADLAQVTEASVDARARSGAGPSEAEPLDPAVSPDDEVIACYDLETGEPLWEHRYPTTYECQFEYSNGPYGTPRIDGGRVYTLGAQWQARCLDLTTGSVVWRRDLAADYDVEEGLFGFGPGLLIDGGRMIFNLGAADAGVIALDAATGGTLWTSGRDRAGYTMPRVATV